MWVYLRRMLNFFFIGFVVTFIIYLLITVGSDDVIFGSLLGAAGGVAVVVLVTFLERRFPDQVADKTR